MTYAIDTHASIKRLADAGVPDNQAEALVELMAQQREDVATKADIAALQSATKADIAALNTTINATINDKIAMINDKMATKIDLAEMKADIATTKADIATINDKMATKIDIAEVKTQLLISMIALGGVMIATIKLF